MDLHPVDREEGRLGTKRPAAFSGPRTVVSALIFALSWAVVLAQRGGQKVSADNQADGPPVAASPRLASLGNLPLAFEANRGQTDPRVKFLARGAGYTLFLASNDAVLTLRQATDARSAARGASITRSHRLDRAASPKYYTRSRLAPSTRPCGLLRMQLVGARSDVRIGGLDELPGKVNYFIGSNPTKWRTNVPTYAKVKYAGVFPGIDLVYYGAQGQLEYDFIIQPGGDPELIRFALKGTAVGSEEPTARKQMAGIGTSNLVPRLSTDGDLVMGSEVRLHKPTVYQTDRRGVKHYVQASYIVRRHRSSTIGSQSLVSFRLARYDRHSPLVIDPVLSYSSYLAGTGYQKAYAAAVTSSGQLTVAGLTNAADFPTADAVQDAYGGGFADAFVTQFSSDGQSLVFSTYLGGSDHDEGWGVATDASGNVYVSGFTASTDFPVTASAYQTAFVGSGYDAFLARLAPSGSSLLYSTYIGAIDIDANGEEMGPRVAAASGRAFVTGTTADPNYPVTAHAFQTTLKGANNGFLTILNTAKSGSASLAYSSFLGGSGKDELKGVALDSADNVYVTGLSYSADFPTTSGAFQPACKLVKNGNCSGDLVLAKMHPAGKGPSDLSYSTYFGGSVFTGGAALAVDSAGDAYVTGTTTSADLPVTSGAFQTSCNGVSCSDGFVSKFHPAGAGLADLVYATYLGGSDIDISKAIALDRRGDAYVAGRTISTDFPVAKPIQAAHAPDAGDYDAFVSELNATGSALLFSTFFGGTDFDSFNGLALDKSANMYPVGRSRSLDFPVTAGAFQIGLPAGSSLNAIAVKIASAGAAGLALGPGNLTFPNQAVGTTSVPQTVTLTAAGTKALTVTSIVASGDFSQTNTCGTIVTAGAACTITVTFTPGAAGTLTGAITLIDNAADSPQNVNLTGTGTD